MYIFVCKRCGAEYRDTMPGICLTPGCENDNPAMWDVQRANQYEPETPKTENPRWIFEPFVPEQEEKSEAPVQTVVPETPVQVAAPEVPVQPVVDKSEKAPAHKAKKKMNKKNLIIIASAVILLAVTAIVLVFALKGCSPKNQYGNLKKKLTNGAWEDWPNAMEFDEDGYALSYTDMNEESAEYRAYRHVGNDIKWSVDDDGILTFGKNKYSFKKYNDADIKRGNYKTSKKTWYVSDKYLIIGNNKYFKMSDEEFERNSYENSYDGNLD